MASSIPIVEQLLFWPSSRGQTFDSRNQTEKSSAHIGEIRKRIYDPWVNLLQTPAGVNVSPIGFAKFSTKDYTYAAMFERCGDVTNRRLAIHLHAFVFNTEDYLRELPGPIAISNCMSRAKETKEIMKPKWYDADALEFESESESQSWEYMLSALITNGFKIRALIPQGNSPIQLLQDTIAPIEHLIQPDLDYIAELAPLPDGLFHVTLSSDNPATNARDSRRATKIEALSNSALAPLAMFKVDEITDAMKLLLHIGASSKVNALNLLNENLSIEGFSEDMDYARCASIQTIYDRTADKGRVRDNLFSKATEMILTGEQHTLDLIGDILDKSYPQVGPLPDARACTQLVNLNDTLRLKGLDNRESIGVLHDALERACKRVDLREQVFNMFREMGRPNALSIVDTELKNGSALDESIAHAVRRLASETGGRPLRETVFPIAVRLVELAALVENDKPLMKLIEDGVTECHNNLQLPTNKDFAAIESLVSQLNETALFDPESLGKELHEKINNALGFKEIRDRYTIPLT